MKGKIIIGAILVLLTCANVATGWVVHNIDNTQHGDEWATATLYDSLDARVSLLDNACAPMRTGGGVIQCAQPSIPSQAIRACMFNDAYQGVTRDDTRALFRQCLTDYPTSIPNVPVGR